MTLAHDLELVSLERIRWSALGGFPETPDLEHDFSDHQRYRPICPPAYIVQCVGADVPRHKRHIGNDPVTHNTGVCKDVNPDHPLLVRFNIPDADRIVGDRGRNQPEQTVQKQSEAEDRPSTNRMKSHVQRGTADHRAHDKKYSP